MPLMNGFDFLGAYQRLPLAKQRAIVIVILTTSMHPHDLERLKDLPVAGFLGRPLNPDKVRDVLRSHFNPA